MEPSPLVSPTGDLQPDSGAPKNLSMTRIDTNICGSEEVRWEDKGEIPCAFLGVCTNTRLRRLKERNKCIHACMQHRLKHVEAHSTEQILFTPCLPQPLPATVEGSKTPEASTSSRSTLTEVPPSVTTAVRCCMGSSTRG
ncbi:hypothetical protein PAMP_009225 [Pampus punctatissimus]